MKDILLIIPAIKKSSVIPDQLVKKLDGITLIQRAINTAKEITNNILVITDSEEISVIADRNKIKYYLEKGLVIASEDIVSKVKDINRDINKDINKDIIIYLANAPLVGSAILIEAYNKFLLDKKVTLTSVKELSRSVFKLKQGAFTRVKNKYSEELKIFYIFNNSAKSNKYKTFALNKEDAVEIESYQDWWVCEKILQRKRIVFNVIGSNKIGMGHIYHSLALAHEITDHEIIFVCDEKYSAAVENIALADYVVTSSLDPVKTIIELSPDLVINDILNTEIEYINKLKTNNIKVVNFEDLGSGAQKADLVINELYDEPKISGNNFLWGYKYLALRNEFNDSKPHSFVDKVSSVLITFGGTDQNNLTLVALRAIIDLCEKKDIKINIICGTGYLFKNDLKEYLDRHRYKNIEHTYAVEVVSRIMNETQIAISSNGRTVYELAQMNIPAIIISHHKREDTHTFAKVERGFINLGVYDVKYTSKVITSKFEKIILDGDYRKLLYLNIVKYSFIGNKKKVISKILNLL